MKAQMLKIAGVKSEKEFYKKFPDEESFMKAHGKEFKKAMRGSKIKKAQVGYDITGSSDGPQLTPSEEALLQQERNWGTSKKKATTTTKTTTTYMPGSSNFKAAPYIQAGVDVIQGISMIKDQKNAVKSAEQMSKLTGAQAAAAASVPVQRPRRQYVFPWDVAAQPDQLGMAYGTGSEILQAQDGTVIRDGIGGNPTEIQNIYNPGDIYSDLGYEPLNDTSKVKQYLAGGKLSKAQNGFETFMQKEGGNELASSLLDTIEGGTPEAGNRIGKGLGMAAGTAFFGPIGGAVGGLIGGALGGIIDPTEERIKKFQKQSNRNIASIVGQQTGRNIHSQYGSIMQNGGYAQNGMNTSVGADCVKTGKCGKEEAQNKADRAQSKADAKANAAWDAAVAREQKAADKQREQEYKDYLNEQLTGYGDKIKQKEFDAAYQAFAAQNPDLAKDRLLYTLANKELNKTRNNPDYRMRGILNRINPTINYSSLTLPQLMQTMQQGFGSGQGYYDAWKAGFPVPKQQDGGNTSPYEWVSHTWQPRTITQFGGHNLKDLLKSPKDADMLRAGGHLKAYTPPSAEAMQTDNFQMGGELQTHWGGYAEPMSQNPYLPEGGETVMFRGQSHDESDGRGNTGIGITYGENPVEVERGEPAVRLRDGGSPDTSLTVFGNIKITKPLAGMLDDANIDGKSMEGMKFKKAAALIAKKTNRQNKIIEKATDRLDSLNVQTAFDQLALGTANAQIMGANAKLMKYAAQTEDLGMLQNAINNTQEEGILDITDKGDVKAKKRKTIRKAQAGTNIPYFTSIESVPANPEEGSILNIGGATYVYYNGDWVDPNAIKQIKAAQDFAPEAPTSAPFSLSQYTGEDEVDNPFYPNWYGRLDRPQNLKQGEVMNIAGKPMRYDANNDMWRDIMPAQQTVAPVGKTKTKKQGSADNVKLKDIVSAANQLLPYLRKPDSENLNPNQLLGELYALSQNQVEPVWAQKLQPELFTPYRVSLQDAINANQADYNATQRQTGYNPAALASLNAQKYAANQKIYSQEANINMANALQVQKENRDILNQYKLQNLGILDKQYQRQAEALSKTKATTQAALNSIASKYAQNKLENRTLAIYENMFNYRFDPRFRAINKNPLAQFNLPDISSYTADELKALTQLAEAKEKKDKDKTGRNGSIVRNLKTL